MRAIARRAGDRAQLVMRMGGLGRVVVRTGVFVMHRCSCARVGCRLRNSQANGHGGPTRHGDGQAKQQDQQGAERAHEHPSLSQCLNGDKVDTPHQLNGNAMPAELLVIPVRTQVH